MRGELGSSRSRRSMIGSRSTVKEEVRVRNRGVQPPETGLQALGERDHRGFRVLREVARGRAIEGQRAQRHLLPRAAELVEVEVDRVAQSDGHRIVDDGPGVTRLVRPAVQRQQCCLRDAGQRAGVDLAVAFHIEELTRQAPSRRLQAARPQHGLVVPEQFVADHRPGAAEDAAPGGQRVAPAFGDQVVDRIRQPGLELGDRQ